ncbi:hypothetical protein JXA12_00005, partial [Candidatus Woesearchaeota archaeon]|nr:hypothetical protein [Candidatus Woesearchaeota archaeon]
MLSNKKVFSGFFMVILLLSMVNIVFSFPVTEGVIEISATETSFEDVTCSIPACVGVYKTGEYYDNGCPVFKCPTHEVVCVMPVCDDGVEPYFTGEVDESG